MDILTALDILSGCLDGLDIEDTEEFARMCQAEDTLYDYVYKKEGIKK